MKAFGNDARMMIADDALGPWTSSARADTSDATFIVDCPAMNRVAAEPQLQVTLPSPPHPAASEDAEDVAVLDPKSSTERRAFRKMLRHSKIFFDTYPREVVTQQALEVGIGRARDADGASLLWFEADPPSLELLRSMSQDQRINFFPGMKLLATKCEFARVVNLARSMVAGTSQADLFSFIPETYVLPRDRVLLNGAAQAVYVVKPDAGCGGDGIYLTADVGNIRHQECVVQKYISPPLLLGDLKFDLRVYVLVTSLQPLRFHIHKEGLARLAVEPYEAPNQKNLYKLNMHLTNYSLNKFSSKFVPNVDFRDDTTCSKRSITTAFHQLADQYGEVFDADVVWSKIEALAETTLTVLLPSLLMAAKERTAVASAVRPDGDSAASGSLVDRCFQIMGFDILLDSGMKPHLLEVNHHPSLQTDAPIDTLVKGSLLKYTLRIVSHETALKFDAKRQARQVKKKLGSKKRSSKSVRAGTNGHDADDLDGGSTTADESSLEIDVPTSRAEWEASVAGDMFITVASLGDQAATPLARRFNLPLNVLREVFLEGGEDARSRRSSSACHMSSLKFAKFMRRVGLVPAWISSGEADLMFIRAAKQQGGPLRFMDFVALALEDLGDLVADETVRGTPERLAAVATFLAAALPE